MWLCATNNLHLCLAFCFMLQRHWLSIKVGGEPRYDYYSGQPLSNHPNCWYKLLLGAYTVFWFYAGNKQYCNSSAWPEITHNRSRKVKTLCMLEGFSVISVTFESLNVLRIWRSCERITVLGVVISDTTVPALHDILSLSLNHRTSSKQDTD